MAASKIDVANKSVHNSHFGAKNCYLSPHKVFATLNLLDLFNVGSAYKLPTLRHY
jgi:hypothetical protein